MSPDEEFNALVQLARDIDPDELPDDVENYVLTISGTKSIGVRVDVRPRAISDLKAE